MQSLHQTRQFKFRLRGALLAVTLLFSSAVFAGPPLVCEPFEIEGASSLPWGGPRWNQSHDGYDMRNLEDDTTALLSPAMPVIVRMETLRRAAIYASRDADIAMALLVRLNARIKHAKTSQAVALAGFDAGYYAETMQDALRARRYGMPGVGEADSMALRASLAKADGAALVDAALHLRPTDAAMHFAAALIAVSDQQRDRFDANARIARASASSDRLVARNLDMIAAYRREIP